MIKAIDTHYKNHKFRSRLEARWAVYFDEFNVSWEYEKEGYILDDGTHYLPDFFLPKYKIFAEVKGQKFTEVEHNKCIQLSKSSGCTVIELVGLPSTSPIDVIIAYKADTCSKCFKDDYYDWDGNLVSCGCDADKIKVTKNEFTDAILLLHSDKESFMPLYYSTYLDEYLNNEVIDNAIMKATSARFEFSDKI